MIKKGNTIENVVKIGFFSVQTFFFYCTFLKLKFSKGGFHSIAIEEPFKGIVHPKMRISQRFTHPQGILGVSDIPHSDEHIQSYIRHRHNERCNIRSGKKTVV